MSATATRPPTVFAALAWLVAVALLLTAALTAFWLTRSTTASAPARNPTPTVIPALRAWSGGMGQFTLGAASRIVLAPPSASQLATTAQVFQADLALISGRTLPIVSSSLANPGDLALTLTTDDLGLGDEGYLLDIGATTRITASTTRGVLYGTRTVLQVLAQDPTHAHLPQGTARDEPLYRERGLLLDVGRKFFSLASLEDYVKRLAWFKLNDLQLHLNDNELNVGNSPDWRQKYAAFRLDSPRFPGLAARDGAYTEDDIRQLQRVATAYGVTITPEIDAPAHDLALTQYRPDLASRGAKDELDLSNPATERFLTDLWDEFLPWFDSSRVHIGADEYTAGSADHYRAFVNHFATLLAGRGKTVLAWGSLTKLAGSVPVSPDVVLDIWNNSWANPVEMARAGHQIVNTNDALLYIVPKAGYYHDFLDTRLLYESWQPYIFDINDPLLNLVPDDPHLLGAMFADWNDRLGGVISDADVSVRVRAALPTIGQKFWGDPATPAAYDEFQRTAQRIGQAPGLHS